jgi:hypothetical protein
MVGGGDVKCRKVEAELGEAMEELWWGRLSSGTDGLLPGQFDVGSLQVELSVRRQED